MNSSVKERRYDLDWLRVLGVLLLVPFHVALIFVLDPNSIMYIKDVVNSRVLDEAAGFVHMWHMPMLFIISGAATYYALGFRSARQYLRERLLRLLAPFLFGVATFIPFTTYIHLIGKPNAPTFLEHYLGFFRIDPNDLAGYSGSFTPAHLWFIFFLFVFSLVGLPLFLILLSDHGKGFVETLAGITKTPVVLFIWGIPLALIASLDLLGDKIHFTTSPSFSLAMCWPAIHVFRDPSTVLPGLRLPMAYSKRFFAFSCRSGVMSNGHCRGWPLV